MASRPIGSQFLQRCYDLNLLQPNTRLNSHLNELEREARNPRTLEFAQRMSQKLSDLEAEFLTHCR